MSAFQELLLTQFAVHEILGIDTFSLEKHFCHEEISEILFRAEVWTRGLFAGMPLIFLVILENLSKIERLWQEKEFVAGRMSENERLSDLKNTSCF